MQQSQTKTLKHFGKFCSLWPPKRGKSRVKSGSANYKCNHHASFSHVSNSRLGADDAVKSFRRSFRFRQAAFLPRSQFRRGTCIACGSEGHWMNNCPNLIFSGRSDKSTKWCFWFCKMYSDSCLFKVGSLRNTLIFGPFPFAPPTLSLTLLLKATGFLSLNCLRILLFPTDLRHSRLKILLTRPFQS